MPRPTESSDAPIPPAPPAKVVTHAGSEDPRLRGGTYSIQFGDVWKTALVVARTLRGWEVLRTDARSGEIVAEVRSWVWKRPDRVTVRITLDEMGLTRVDLGAAPLAFRLGLSLTRRRIGRFVRALEAALRPSV